MSVDYRVTLKNKYNNSEILSFWYNYIKNLDGAYIEDLDLYFNPKIISGNSEHPTVLTVFQLESDIGKLQAHIKYLESKISEQKLMMLMANKSEIYEIFKTELQDLNMDCQQFKYMYLSLESLRILISTYCEERLINDENKYISIKDVNIELLASF